MEINSVKKGLKWFILLALIATLTVNALSSILPINGVTPKEVSDRYPNLFVPSPLTFAIWGVIYLLVFCYMLFQFGLFRGKGAAVNAALLTRTGIVFIVSCLLNLSWVIAWHYGLLMVSFGILALFLLAMISIRLIIAAQEPLSVREKWFVRLPFSVYFGWVTIAGLDNAGARRRGCDRHCNFSALSRYRIPARFCLGLFQYFGQSCFTRRICRRV